jgi:quercetin dioxygenase-like cupin family protein
MGTEKQGEVIHRAAAARRWRPTSHAGVEVCGLRDNGAGGGAALVKVAAGARVPTHDHPGGEEVLLIEGRAVVGGITLRAGDYLWTSPGEAHDLRAEEDTVLFVTTPNGVRVLE